jgi:predicted DNA-binding protein (MmcQ/YjbR family)
VQRDELVAYCPGKPGAEESSPWGEEELVAKVGGKGFASYDAAVAALPKGRRSPV